MNAINTLPPDLIQEWYDVCYKLPVLSHISIPRWKSQGTDTDFVELLGFSDASRLAYSAVVYMHLVTKSGQISVKILMYKTKVAPIKTISISNIELCAAALLTKLILFVVQSLQLDDMPIFCWTDSTTVLDWLQKKPITLPVFVANRISTIQTPLSSAFWNRFSSKQNPADCASRGLTAEKLVKFSLWWKCPAWLSSSREAWPQQKIQSFQSNSEHFVSAQPASTGIDTARTESD